MNLRKNNIQLAFLFCISLFAFTPKADAQFSTELTGLGAFSTSPGFGNPTTFTTKSLGSGGWDQPHHPSNQQYNADGTLVETYNGTAFRTSDGSLAGTFINDNAAHVNQWSNVDPDLMYSTTATKCTKKVLGGSGTTVFDLNSAKTFFGLNFNSFWGGSLEGSFIVGEDKAIAVFGLVGTQAYCLVWKIGVGWLPDKYLMPLAWNDWDLYCATPISDPKVAGNLGYVYCKDINQGSDNTKYPWRIISITETGASAMQNGSLKWTNHASMCVWQDSDGSFRPGLIDIYGNVIEPGGTNFSIGSSWTGSMHVGWIRGTIFALGENDSNGANAMALRKTNHGGYKVLANGSSTGNTSYAGCYAKSGITNVNFLNPGATHNVQMRIISYQAPGPADTIAPTAPAGLTSDNISSTTFTLSWTASTDNIGIGGYEVFKAGISVGTAIGTSLNITGLGCDETNSFTVKARDAAGNWSDASLPLNVKTSVCIPCTLPSGWTGVDIGATGQSSCEDAGTFTIVAAGTDIWSTSDQFRYTYKSLTGDGVIIAKVRMIQNTDLWAKSGVMIRETLAANSKHVDCYVTSGNGISFQLRSATAGSTSSTLVAGISAPHWVKLERTGNIFNAYHSADGTNWTKVGASTTVTMSANVYIGLAATSHVDGIYCTSAISDVSTTGDINTSVPIVGAATSSGVSFFPNPVLSNLSINNIPPNAEISFFTIDGKLVGKAQNGNSNSLEIDVSEWNKGVYFFRIKSEKVSVVRKVIVE